MNQNVKKIWTMLLLPLLAAALLFPVRAFAEEYSCTVELPAEVHTGGNNVPEGMEYTLNLKPADEATPMPETAAVTVKDNGSAKFGPITYEKPGDYVYTVWQTKGGAAYVTYDATVYTVTVRVTNKGASASDGLTAEVWAIKNDSEVKVSNIAFANSYDPPKPEVDEHPEIAQAIKDGTWGGKPTAQPAANRLPQTGDSANPILWVVVMAAALAALAAVAVLRRRGKNDKT